MKPGPGTADALRIVLQHGEEAHDPYAWSWEPTVIAGTALIIAAYLYGVGPLRRRYHLAEGRPTTRIVLFLAGILVFFFALVSPLDVLGDEYLFSAHMVQHLLMSVVTAPLLLLGTPGWLLRPVLGAAAVSRVARALTHPAAALLVYNATFAAWHWPALYELALADERVHIVQHLSFLATALLNWWPVLSPLPELPRLSYPLRVLYLFADCQPGVALGALFVLSRDVLYRSYVEAPRVIASLSPLSDQQLGGLIMWIPGNGIYLVTLSIVFLRWFHGNAAAESGADRGRVT